MQNLVSVIVPVYNVEKYLDRCLRSIINQTHQNLEIIVVNDGSTDGSYDICKRYAGADRRIILIDQENQGLSGARNTGLEIMRGDFVAFVDSDDALHPDAIKHMYQAIRNRGMAACISDYQRVTEMEQTEALNYASQKASEISVRGAWLGLFSEEHIRYGCMWGKLYKSELFQEIRFPVGRTYEDIFVNQEIFGKCKYICLLEETLYYYTERQGSISQFWTAQKIEDSLIATEHRVRYFMAVGDQELILKAVRLHLNHAIDCYFRTRIRQEKNVVRKHFTSVWKGVPDCSMSVVEKMKFCAFIFTPEIYPLLMKAIDKLTK